MSKPILFDRIRLVALCLLCVGLPAQWGDVPYLNMTYANASVVTFLLIGIPLVFVDRYRVGASAYRLNALYAVMLIVTLVFYILYETPAGFKLVYQGLTYVVTAIVFSMLAKNSAELALLGRVGMISSAIFITASAASVNINFPVEYVDRLINYSYGDMLSRFYRPIFNGLSGGGELTYDIKGTRRNQLSSSLLVLMFFVIVAYRSGHRSAVFKWLDGALVIFALSLLLTMFARSTVVILVLAVLVSFLNIRRVSTGTIITAALVFISLLGLFVFFTSYSDFGSSVNERLFEDTVSYEYRASQWLDFGGAGVDQLMFGGGLFVPVGGSTLHNILLANWAAAGLIGLAVTCAFVFYVAYQQLRLMQKAYCIYAMLLSPLLVKVMVAGNAGHAELSSLLAATVGLMYADKVRTDNS